MGKKPVKKKKKPLLEDKLDRLRSELPTFRIPVKGEKTAHQDSRKDAKADVKGDSEADSSDSSWEDNDDAGSSESSSSESDSSDSSRDEDVAKGKEDAKDDVKNGDKQPDSIDSSGKEEDVKVMRNLAEELEGLSCDEMKGKENAKDDAKKGEVSSDSDSEEDGKEDADSTEDDAKTKMEDAKPDAEADEDVDSSHSSSEDDSPVSDADPSGSSGEPGKELKDKMQAALVSAKELNAKGLSLVDIKASKGGDTKDTKTRKKKTTIGDDEAKVKSRKRAKTAHQIWIQEQLADDKFLPELIHRKMKRLAKARELWKEKKPVLKRQGDKKMQCPVLDVDSDSPCEKDDAKTIEDSKGDGKPEAQGRYGCPRCRMGKNGCDQCNPEKKAKKEAKKAAKKEAKKAKAAAAKNTPSKLQKQ